MPNILSLDTISLLMYNRVAMSFKISLDQAVEELLRLEQEKSDLERRTRSVLRQMRALTKIIEGLREYPPEVRVGDDKEAEVASAEDIAPTLPAAILAVLSIADRPVSAPQIRDKLVVWRAAELADRYLLVNIHTSIRRLIKAGRVAEVPSSEATKFYRYITPMEQALATTVPLSSLVKLEIDDALPHGFGRGLVDSIRRSRKE
jgi:hypothetical protein